MNEEEKLMFSLGVIAGEGSFSGDKNHPRVAVKQRDNVELLEILRETLGGRINGPYRYAAKDGYNDREYGIWSLDGSQLLAALPLLCKMPQCRKREQIVKWLAKWNLSQ